MQFRSGGHRWGLNRAVEPKGSLPQAALKLDPSLPPFETEIVISAQALQIDSASFHQLSRKSEEDNNDLIDSIKNQVQHIVATRGKMHNPVTNSGGVLLGKILTVGPAHPLHSKLKEGDSVVTLISLTLTPLLLHEINRVDPKKERLEVKGHAIIFESGLIAKMPSDFSEGVTLAALDICGAPAQTKRLVSPNDRILVLGLGKAGRTIATQACELGARVFGVDLNQSSVDWCRTNLSGKFNVLNAQDPVAVFEWIQTETRGELVDMSFHATNVDNTEMAAILPCRDQGKVLFFGMHTSFQKAVLGAEGAGKDVTLLMGNGFVPGHAELMLDLLRNNRALKAWFEENFS